MINRTQAHQLLEQYITSPSLRRHSEMVAQAMEAYAKKLGEDPELWYTSGLLHDLDWEQFPDEHPNKAIADILPAAGASQEMLDAIAAHAPGRTGKQAETLIEKYLFACDELCGFIDALAKLRPNGYSDMEWSSVKKKLKDKAFAANVSREDIAQGAEMIGVPLSEHTVFLISIFR
jgi:putative nucleotidyltransferase with HDIG domain